MPSDSVTVRVTQTDAADAASADRVVAGVDLGDAELARVLRSELEQVEQLLVDRLNMGEDFLSDIALHLVSAGGKRFRPLVTLLCGQLGSKPDQDRLVTAAVVCEMVHLATLYHDDVMDEATTRRGVESANSRWDNSVAILAGDFLFAHSSMLLAELGPEAVGLIARTFAELVTGQMRETVGQRGDDSAEHYLTVIWEKTGSLIAAAARFGGMYSGATEEQIDCLSRFGDAVGVAFQIADDLIDIASPTANSGKTPGTDLREGVRTLPMLYVLENESDTSAETARLRELLAGPISEEAEVQEALELLTASDGMQRARATLQEYVNKAMAELDQLPAGPANEALRELVRFTVERVG